MKRCLSVILLFLAVLVTTSDTTSAYYSTTLGRFINRDPIGYEGSPWNLYEYVDGMPLTQVDPSGHKIIGDPLAPPFPGPTPEPTPGPVHQEPELSTVCQIVEQNLKNDIGNKAFLTKAAVTTCFMGKSAACVFENNIRSEHKNAKAAQFNIDCNRAHEGEHTKQMDCSNYDFNTGTNCYAPNFLPGFEALAARECDAHKVELSCQQSKLGLTNRDMQDQQARKIAIDRYCNHNVQCINEITKLFNETEKEAIDYCGKALALPPGEELPPFLAY